MSVNVLNAAMNKTQKEGITLPFACSNFAEIHFCISLKNKDRLND